VKNLGYEEVFFMRIVFASDVHHAFRQVGELLNKTEADLYVIAGDLVSRAFFRYRTAWRFMELQQILTGKRSDEKTEMTLEQLAKSLVEDAQEMSLSIKAKEYIQLCKKAESYLQKSYGRLEEMLARHPQKSIYALPGNYDMDLRQTVLRERNLHLESFEMEGWRIAGYGGASVMTPGTPDHLQVPYREQRDQGGIKSEALDFFRTARPNLIVLHQPPYGYLDYLPGYGHAGSPGVRDYIDEAEVKLVLSGHHHDQWGGAFANNISFFNPSNFGRTIEVSRSRPGGFFLELSLENNSVDMATLRKLDRGNIYDVVDYQPSDGQMEMLILDEKRYAQLGGKVPKVHHIRPVRQLQNIKSFFLGYETPETQDLIKELRGIYRGIEKEGMEVAFDLLGSLSFGMAQEGSDMDVVVYVRSRDCVLDDEDTCGIPRPLASVIKALEERNLSVEVCDSIDLDRVKQAIQDKNLTDGHLQRFIFYRLVCRPVNLRLIKSVENLLLKEEHFRREMEKGLQEYLDILVSSVRHISSFEKYRARLRERGIKITPDVEEAIRNYLRG
jgi:Icc-related predicted phosphoesterase